MTKTKQGTERVQLDQEYILHLLKYGRQEEIRQLVRQQERENYSDSFVPFMDQMIREHNISRKNVAIRSGLSQDYVYKLLRGDKRTDERDYILAMCLAIKMNLPQTQHALSSYGMPILSERDLRSHIMIIAFQDGYDMDRLNEMLEKAGFPLLRVSPDMPKALITNTAPAEQAEIRKTEEAPITKERREFEEIDSFVDGRHNGGNAPFDYDYEGWIKLKDQDDHVYQVEAVFKTECTSFIVFTEEQRKEAEKLMLQREQSEKAFYEKHKDIIDAEDGYADMMMHPELLEEYTRIQSEVPEAEMLEDYDSLAEAAGSEFFPYFLEIDKRTDKKVREVLQKLDDTREYGMRFGACWQKQPQVYVEAFNTSHPEMREYMQIIMYRDGTCRYTAAHESCFMQIEMGQDLYEAIFGPKREPEFFIDTDRNDFSGPQVRYRFIFNRLKVLLDEFAMKNVPGMIDIDPHALTNEKIEVLVEKGVLAAQEGRQEAAAAAFREAIKAMEDVGAPGNDCLASYVCTCCKLANLVQAPEAEEWWSRIIALEEAVKKAVKDGREDCKGALSCVTEALIHDFVKNSRQQNNDRAKESIKEAVALIEEFNAAEDDWSMQFEAYSDLAYYTENDDLEASLKYYRRSITIARDHHLDQDPRCARAVAVQYNNYAWVLWNKCGSEEAVLYYGRAIELLESYLYSGIVDHDTVLTDLDHMGFALHDIYVSTSRTREAERLSARLKENGVFRNK